MASIRMQRTFQAAAHLRCPVCHASLSVQEPAALRCSKGHAYNVSSKGTVNFVPQTKPLKGYDAHFFQCRRSVVQAGLYDSLTQALIEAVSVYLQPCLSKRPVLLDAGCGEGHMAATMAQSGMFDQVLAVDLAKDAIAQCAKGDTSGAVWMVANLASLPVGDGAVDCLLNVYSPANYQEFTRVLAPGGLLIKVVPGPEHMAQLRRAVGLPAEGSRTTSEVEDLFKLRFDLVESRLVTQTSPVPAHLLPDLLGMTPVLFDLPESGSGAVRTVGASACDGAGAAGVSTSGTRTPALEEITIQGRVLVGRRR
ncbi:MAG: methyltransferase domain-containing protein [Eggerthellales bacterium]|nr:methyltransferase domain-containing protein [Eggerthellales bacterium]